MTMERTKFGMLSLLLFLLHASNSQTISHSKTESFDQLLAIGFWGRPQVINLDPSSTPCYSLKPIFSRGSLFNGAFFDGAPTLCSASKDTCLRYDPVADLWQGTKYSPIQRFNYGHVGTLLDDGRWLISGGYSFDPATDESDVTNVISEFIPSAGPGGSVTVQAFHASLPYPKANHVFTNFNSSHVLFISSDPSSNTGYEYILRLHILDITGRAEDWLELPSLLVEGEDFYPGVITNEQGEQEIVISGFFQDYLANDPGHEDLSSEYSKILNLASGDWRDAKAGILPRQVSEAAIVPGYGNSFILAGGTFYLNEENDQPSEKLYSFDPLSESWVELDTVFNKYVGMYDAPVFSVPKGYFQC